MRDENREACQAVEAIVMVAEEPVPPGLMAQLIEIPTEQVEAICAQLAEEYRAEGRGFELVRMAGGYRFRSHTDTESYVKRFVVSGQSSRLSSAALETLAIVAYKQPLSRAQVSAIRGVNAEGAMRTLQQRGLVYEVGRDPGPAAPGYSPPPRRSWSGWVSMPSTNCRPWSTLCLALRSSRPWRPA